MRDPVLLAEFNLDWSWALGDPDGVLDMGFHDIRLDAGAFISKFVKPVLDKIQTVTQPLQPFVDLLTSHPTIRLGLQAFYRSQDMDHAPQLKFLQAELGRVLALEDAAEGIAAFLGKRKPVWKGR